MSRTFGVPKLFRRLIRLGAHALGYEIVRRPIQFNPLWLHLERLLAQQEINCVIDVGAHYGEYGNALRGLGYRGRIVSFEPIAANYEVLARRCAADALWTCHRWALADRSEERTFHVTTDSVFSSMLTPNEYSLDWSGRGSRVERTEKVNTRRLDDPGFLASLVPELDSVRALLKVDTQGADPAVISGANGILSQVRALQSEVSVRPLYHDALGYRECIAEYERLGFELTGLFPCAQEEDQRVVEFDCVMIRSAAATAATATAGSSSVSSS
ncbi:MAG: FkbM family methyltransferase [Planctomycetota bacterium]